MKSRFIKPMATALIACLLVGTPGSAWAADTDLPVLDESSGVLSSTTLARNDTLTFSYRITDDVSCCSFALWGIYTVPGTNVDQGRVYYSSTSFANRVSGNAQDGRYSQSLQIPSDLAAGTYYLKVQSIDNAGRYTYLGQIASFTVLSPDTDLPVLDEASGVLSSTTPARNSTLTFSFRVTDDVACCSLAIWGIYTIPGTNVDQGRIFYGGTGAGSPNRVSGTAQDGRYSHSLRIPSDIAAGTYYLKVQLQDNVSRYTYLGQIASFTISAQRTNTGTNTGTNAGSNAGSSSGTNTSSGTSTIAGKLTMSANYKKVVKQKSILKTLGIKKGKTDSISYKVSNKSKKVCSANSTGVKPKKQGTCEVTVTKVTAKKQKTGYSLSINFVK